jgi:hypothetical protein
MLGEFTNPDGILHPVLVAVQDDPELDLEIRNRYVNIYYRGTNLMQINETGRGGQRLTAFFEPLYLPDPDPDKRSTTWKKKAPTADEAAVHAWLRRHDVLGSHPLETPATATSHVASFCYRKKASLGTSSSVISSKGIIASGRNIRSGPRIATLASTVSGLSPRPSPPSKASRSR